MGNDHPLARRPCQLTCQPSRRLAVPALRDVGCQADAIAVAEAANAGVEVRNVTCSFRFRPALLGVIVASEEEKVAPQRVSQKTDVAHHAPRFLEQHDVRTRACLARCSRDCPDLPTVEFAVAGDIKDRQIAENLLRPDVAFGNLASEYHRVSVARHLDLHRLVFKVEIGKYKQIHDLLSRSCR